MHDKFAIFDGRILAHGTVKWSGHAMISGGLLAIHDDERILLPVVASFEDKMKSYRLVEEHKLLKICKWCARYWKASGRRAEQKKRAAKRAACRMKKRKRLEAFLESRAQDEEDEGDGGSNS